MQTTYGVFVLFQVVVYKKVRKYQNFVIFQKQTFELAKPLYFKQKMPRWASFETMVVLSVQFASRIVRNWARDL